VVALSLLTAHGPLQALDNAPDSPGHSFGVSSDFPKAPELPGRIAYSRDEGAKWNVFVADPNGENEQKLTDYKDSIWQEHIRWTADGQTLVYDLFPGNATYKLFVMPSTGGEPQEIPIEGNVTDPSVRPGPGPLVLALARREGADDSLPHDIYTWSEASGLEGLATTEGVDERGPDWSPDGRQLAYERKPSGNKATWDIWRMSSDGSDPQPLIAWPDSSERLARWSPDGSRLAFVAGTTGQGLGSLYVLDLDSGGVANYVDLVDGPLAWSPDGHSIMFHSPRTTGPVPRGNAPAPDGHAEANRGPKSLDMEPPVADPTEPPVAAPMEPRVDDTNMGLYIVSLDSHQIVRLHGAAGGQITGTLLGGYAPDWLAPSPTPTPTSTPTATASPTPTATPPYLPGPIVWLPALFNDLEDGTPAYLRGPIVWLPALFSDLEVVTTTPGR
jgi:hypothetical protein